jgi:hypothetical protein
MPFASGVLIVVSWNLTMTVLSSFAAEGITAASACVACIACVASRRRLEVVSDQSFPS